MFYETENNNHGLEYNPFKSLVVPRAIGWLSTLSPEGNINLAPFSQWTMLNFDPPHVMISAGAHPDKNRLKDTVWNIEQTGEFVFNMAICVMKSMSLLISWVPKLMKWRWLD